MIKLDEWVKHCTSLLVENAEEFLQNNSQPNTPKENYNNVQITEDEFIQLNKMKNGRSSGPGNINIELVKYGGKKLQYRLTNLMNACCEQLQIPQEWKISFITSIFKKGNKRDPNCYRGLSVNNSISRLFTKILQEKVRQDIGDNISEDQSGFVPGRSCVDNLFILQQLLEKKISVNDEIYLAFIDLKKAYDSIPQTKLWDPWRRYS